MIGVDLAEGKTLNTRESGDSCNIQENMTGDYGEVLRLFERQTQ